MTAETRYDPEVVRAINFIRKPNEAVEIISCDQSRGKNRNYQSHIFYDTKEDEEDMILLSASERAAMLLEEKKDSPYFSANITLNRLKWKIWESRSYYETTKIGDIDRIACLYFDLDYIGQGINNRSHAEKLEDYQALKEILDLTIEPFDDVAIMGFDSGGGPCCIIKVDLENTKQTINALKQFYNWIAQQVSQCDQLRMNYQLDEGTYKPNQQTAVPGYFNKKPKYSYLNDDCELAFRRRPIFEIKNEERGYLMDYTTLTRIMELRGIPASFPRKTFTSINHAPSRPAEKRSEAIIENQSDYEAKILLSMFCKKHGHPRLSAIESCLSSSPAVFQVYGQHGEGVAFRPATGDYSTSHSIGDSIAYRYFGVSVMHQTDIKAGYHIETGSSLTNLLEFVQLFDSELFNEWQLEIAKKRINNNKRERNSQ